jgi:hypothetical protein
MDEVEEVTIPDV